MTALTSNLARYCVTAIFVALAGFLGWHTWSYYMTEPWTRDGKVHADVVDLAPDVSGLVSSVEVKDNQVVSKGDVIFKIDTARFELAVLQAQSEVEGAQATLDQAEYNFALYAKLGDGAATQQKIQESRAEVAQAQASLKQALVKRDTARLDLDRTAVRAPVNGKLSNFSLRPGNYVNAGSTVTALVDQDSYYVTGYFEEGKVKRIALGDSVEVFLVGSSEPLHGHVSGIAAGIEDRERSDTKGALANVNPTFTWVRLAQRIPVRIELGPHQETLVVGETATVQVQSD
ncbi:efflux RND transporter periplasmic adaptor subunit [Agrobacterium rhizogenes]|nr:efflux RND transporter periplasmic adaptor subunit [Rhizobium rhizogenes]NTJ79418.1 efflux RND transporter periplasmic adaptor subunit [Rhizobium rhizogenes]